MIAFTGRLHWRPEWSELSMDAQGYRCMDNMLHRAAVELESYEAVYLQTLADGFGARLPGPSTRRIGCLNTEGSHSGTRAGKPQPGHRSNPPYDMMDKLLCA